MFGALGWPAGQASALNNLGTALRDLGELRAAVAHHREALLIHRHGHGSPGGEATTLHNLGDVHRDLGNLRTATLHLTRSLRLRRSLGDRNSEPPTLSSIAAIHAAAGRYAEATEYARAALSAAAPDQYTVEVDATNVMGTVDTARGRTSQARARHRVALEIAEKAGYPRGQVEALLGLTACEPDPTTALVLARRAGQLGKRHQLRLLHARSLAALATAQVAADDPRAARRSAAKAHVLYARCGCDWGEREATCLIDVIVDRLRVVGDVRRH